MRLDEIYRNAPYFKKYGPWHQSTADRFTELGIHDAFPYFEDWIYHGAFKLPQSRLMMYEQAFHLINSVLPPEVLNSYGRLPDLYRGMTIRDSQAKLLHAGGIPIQSRIMAWTPFLQHAKSFYTRRTGNWVIMEYHPQEDEVLVHLNYETIHFLRVDPRMIANDGEAILSLPLLRITPEMVILTNILT